MIEQPQLEFWHERLRQGERLSLHRKEQLQLVEELLSVRQLRQNEQHEIDALKETHEREMNALRIQLQQINATISIVAGRGMRTQGSFEQGAPAVHGEVHSWPEDIWPGMEIQCDWGNCEKIAIVARYDAHGFGWLPCCEDCAKEVVP
jgi:hypothetical protein